MNHLLPAPHPTVPGLVPSAFDQAMTDWPTLWGRLKLGMHNGRRPLEIAIAEAETMLATPELVDQVGQIAKVATPKERDRFLQMLVSAWPNASQGDLAGYGAQLNADVEEHRPSVYALNEASRQLRRTAKFLPSICEVLDAITAADKRVGAIVKTIDFIPEVLAEAKRVLADDRQTADDL